MEIKAVLTEIGLDIAENVFEIKRFFKHREDFNR